MYLHVLLMHTPWIKLPGMNTFLLTRCKSVSTKCNTNTESTFPAYANSLTRLYCGLPNLKDLEY